MINHSLKRYLTIIVLLLCHFSTLAQLDGFVSSRTLVNIDGQTPFWLYSGANGVIEENKQVVTQYIRPWLNYSKSFNDSKYTIEARLASSIYNTSSGGIKGLLDQYSLSLSSRIFKLDIGAKSDNVRYNGLSATNGDMLMSNNALPYPMLKFSTNGFVSLPFKIADKWFDWYAEYGEGLLNDDRYVDEVHIHQKKLHFRLKVPKILAIEVGLDDYVQWGGVSPDPNIGQMDESFEGYYRAILGMQGGDTGLDFDKKNVAGNHISQHVFRLSHENKFFKMEAYYFHLFEDGSGKRFNNFPDGTWGIFIDRSGDKFFDSMVAEYATTLDQSGRYHDPENHMYGQDNYMGNYIYKSGWTYHNKTIGTPFMIPQENNLGFESSRFISYYLGAMGYLNYQVKWKLRASYLKHYARYFEEDPSSIKDSPEYPKNQQSYSFELDYSYKSRWVFTAQLGYDHGDLLGNNLGLIFGVSYLF
ncbi:capsule assembly Wzi family protein [Halosquirtibacter xylanolyticus]|uniref:capsule assembly Wzi family protein n=1 Tax=Halosquirtibacter xylanolyticus TaxID=3374599 RepID=UPI003749BEF9|nr:capsule assembly Wzi family protein [Prolixibacteraceae bacterium]